MEYYDVLQNKVGRGWGWGWLLCSAVGRRRVAHECRLMPPACLPCGPQVGGGKPKMRHYCGENGWPTTSILK